MKQVSAGALASAWSARNHHNRRAFRIGAGDRVHQIEGSGSVGNHRYADATVVARRRVSRKAYGRFVAQREIRKNVAFFDDLEERQHEITRDAKNLPGAVVLEAFKQSVRERGHT